MDVIGRVVSLKKTGGNYKGLCPFHNEKTPSFVVSETKQIFSCFGCSTAGNVFTFVQKYYNTDFPGAMEKLAAEYGVDFAGGDYKKNGGYKRSVEMSGEYELYRQNYCGCEFSKGGK